MARLVVIGGGPSGLAAALFSARRGHSVLILERDADHPSEDADICFETWRRLGVGQIRQAHQTLALGNLVLTQEAPDVFAKLSEDAPLVPMINPPLPGVPMFLGVRRTTFESGLRQAVDAEPGVDIMTGAIVSGLVANEGTPTPHVSGVRIKDGRIIEADLVIDASGRATQIQKWLAAIGARPCPEEHQRVGFTYLTRWYRLNEGAELPQQVIPPGMQSSYGYFLAVLGDRRTFCLVMIVSNDDPLRQALSTPEAFDKVASEVPLQAPWLAAGTGITKPQAFANVHNCNRSLVDEEGPIVTGLLLVGDSASHTNPTLGRGLSLSLAHAQEAARSADQATVDPIGHALAFAKWTDDNVGIWYETQAATDFAAAARMQAIFTGAPVPQAAYPARVFEALATCAATDESFVEVFQSVAGVLTPIKEVLKRPGVMQRIEPFLDNAGHAFPPCPLTRDRFEQLVMSAAG